MKMVNRSDLVVEVALTIIRESTRDAGWELIAPGHGD